MKFEFTREDALMIREALECRLAVQEKNAKRSGCLAFKLEAKCLRELIENFDRQYEEARA